MSTFRISFVSFRLAIEMRATMVDVCVISLLHVTFRLSVRLRSYLLLPFFFALRIYLKRLKNQTVANAFAQLPIPFKSKPLVEMLSLDFILFY